jgi:hypothetical protein
MNKRCAFESDWETFVYYNDASASVPKLIGEDNTALVPEFKELPFYQHLNTLIANCLARNPVERPTALDLYNQFEDLWNDSSDWRLSFDGLIVMRFSLGIVS